MANAIVGALRVTLGLDSAAFENGLSGAQKQLNDAGSRMKSVGQRMAGIGAGLSVAVTAPLVAFGTSAFQAAVESSEAIAQVEAALASMGPTAGRTSEQLQEAAASLQSLSSYDDDEILRKVTSNLLTFGQVSGDVFDRAQVAIVDLSARLGQDLQSSAMMVGKALNDPVKGLNALRRTGIQFTEDQDQMIKGMVAAGDVAGAQAIMLGELERQFGGAAKAARDAAPGSDTIDAWRELQETVGALIMRALDPLANIVTGVLNAFNNLSPGVQTVVVAVAAFAAAVGPVLVVLGGAVAAIGVLVTAMAPLGAAMLAIPFAPVIAGVAAVVAAFLLFKDDILPAVQTFGAGVMEVMGPKLQPLMTAVMGVVRALGEVFSAIFGGSGSSTADLTAFGEIVGRVFGAAVELITGAINVVTNILKALGALLRGDFSAMWGFLGQAVGAAVGAIGRAFQTLLPEVTAWVRQTYEAVREWLVGRFEDIVRGIGEKVAKVTGFFRDMYIAVVGNSFVPDMVREIGDWMGGKLRSALVDPAKSATDEASSAFAGMSSDVESQLEGLFKSISSKDWKGALGGIFGLMGKSSGKLGSFGRIGASILGGLPGFKRGGSFNVGGSGTADSKMVAFRATPGERVDISTPAQQRQQGGGSLRMLVNPSPYFDLQVQKVAAPLAYGAAAQGADYARAQTQKDMQRRAWSRLR